MTLETVTATEAVADKAQRVSRQNRKVVLGCLTALGFMGAITAVSPTLYSLFCQVTGYGGTTQRAAAPSHQVLDRVMTVRFDANVSAGLPLKFEPVVKTMKVKIGDNTLAFYRATNLSDKPLKMTAGFNVAPETMGLYFNKIECFCFTEQTLKPGETVEMPLTFYLDPKLVDDADTRLLSNVTLSYVFYPIHEAASLSVGVGSTEAVVAPKPTATQ